MGTDKDYGIIHRGEVLLADGKKVPLTELKIIEHRGDGEIVKHKRKDGKAIRLNNSEIKIVNGLEVKAPAEVVFELPAGAKQFKAQYGVSDLGETKSLIQIVAGTEKREYPLPRVAEGVMLCGPGKTKSEEQPHWVWIGNYISKKIFGYTEKAILKALNKTESAQLEELKIERDDAKRYPESELEKIQKEYRGKQPKDWPESKQKRFASLKKSFQDKQNKLNQKFSITFITLQNEPFDVSGKKGEFEPLKRLYLSAMKEEDSFQKAARLVIQKVLMSPDFLYRYEANPIGTEAMPIDDFELANRLSYFLWSSMPDDKLMAKAKAGSLHNEKVLEQEVKRMLKDPKSESLAKEFADQWLGLRSLMGERRPNADIFKIYDDRIRDLMVKEVHLSFMDMVRENKSVLSLVDTNETYLNDSLATYYKIPNIKGSNFRKVNIAKYRGGGLLGYGAVHVATSYPDRTSPILRGLWILETLLGNPTPPPPEDVPIDEAAMVDPNLTMKERFAQHRENPTCAICHDRIDPIGFTMESFDAAGRFRQKDGKHAIDDLGELKNGTKIKGVQGLRNYILNEERGVPFPFL